jgi:glycosyltransferase involved in cell wall biosynthesis
MLMLLYLWVGASCVLLVYYLFIVFPFAFGRKEKSTPASTALPDLSVIICARNELDNLKANVSKVLNQHYAGNFEVVVVNDASTDGSAAWLEEMQHQHTNLKLLHLEERQKRGEGKKGALAFGIEAATYEHLVLTDADCAPAGVSWLSTVASHFAESALVLGYGPVHLPPDGEEVDLVLEHFCRWEAFNTALTYFSFAHAGYPYMGVGRNLAYTKTLYKQVGGFDAHMHLTSGDDDLFVKAAEVEAKPSLMLESTGNMYSPPPKTWSAWFKQRKRHLSTAYVYKPAVKAYLGVLGIANLIFYSGLVLLLIYPIKWIGLLLLVKLLVQYFAYARVARRLGEGELWSISFFMEFLSTVFTAYLHMYHAFRPKKKIVWS